MGTSGDTLEWRSVKAVDGVLIRIFGSIMRISNMHAFLTYRHSGHHTQFKTEISKVLVEFPKVAFPI